MEPNATQERPWSQGYCFITNQIAQNIDLSVVRFPRVRYMMAAKVGFLKVFVAGYAKIYGNTLIVPKNFRAQYNFYPWVSCRYVLTPSEFLRSAAGLSSMLGVVDQVKKNDESHLSLYDQSYSEVCKVLFLSCDTICILNRIRLQSKKKLIFPRLHVRR